MARYIDADKAIELIKNYGKGAISDGLTTLDAVDDIVYLAKGVDLIPTADVVEVVRCQHCRFVSITQPDGTIHCGRESVMGVGTVFRKADDFCSYGERKKVE